MAGALLAARAGANGFKRAVGGSHDLATLTGMVSRYRADSVTGLSNGASVPSWPDSSGNGYTAAQGTTAFQPTFVTSAVNGKPALRWPVPGTVFLTSSAPAGQSTQTVLMVVTPTSGSVGSNSSIRGADSVGGLQTRLMSGFPNNVAQNQADLGSSTTAAVASTPVVVLTTYGPSGSAWRVNGATAGTSGTTSTLNGSATTWIGGNGASVGEWWQGDILEIVTWNRVLTSSELGYADSYVQDFYAITVSDYA